MSHTPVILTYIIYLFYQRGHFSLNADPENTGKNLSINTASAKKMWTFSNSVVAHLELRNLFMVYLMTFPVPQTISCWMAGYKALAHNWWFDKMS